MAEVSVVANQLLKRLSRGMQSLLLSVVALGATALLWASTGVQSLTLRQFLNAVATGLLVSAAFGIAQALITSRVSTEMLRASVVEEVSRSLAQSNTAHFPSDEFPASEKPDPLFNARLTQDLRATATFWFRGMSARYTAVRLALNQNVSLQAHIILPDPCVEGTLDGRIEYYLRNKLSTEIDEIKSKLKHSISLGIVGLLDASLRCATMEIILTPMPLLDRYEIFRDAIWVTLYSDPGQGTAFPRTLRFSEKSVMYVTQQADCLQTRNHPASRVVQVPRCLTKEAMLDVYHQITGETLTGSDRDRLLIEFRELMDDFTETRRG